MVITNLQAAEIQINCRNLPEPALLNIINQEK
jgi:hypothetical protein